MPNNNILNDISTLGGAGNAGWYSVAAPVVFGLSALKMLDPFNSSGLWNKKEDKGEPVNPYYKPYDYQQSAGDLFNPEDMQQNYKQLMSLMQEYPDLWKNYTNQLSNPSGGNGVLPLSGLLAQPTTNYEQPFYQQYQDQGFQNNLPGRTPIDQMKDMGGQTPNLGNMNQGNVNAGTGLTWQNPTAPFGGQNNFSAPTVPFQGVNESQTNPGGTTDNSGVNTPGTISTDTGTGGSLIDRSKLAELLMGLVGRADSLKPMQYSPNTTKYNAPDLGMFDFNATKADLLKRYGGV